MKLIYIPIIYVFLGGPSRLLESQTNPLSDQTTPWTGWAVCKGFQVQVQVNYL